MVQYELEEGTGRRLFLKARSERPHRLVRVYNARSRGSASRQLPTVLDLPRLDRSDWAAVARPGEPGPWPSHWPQLKVFPPRRVDDILQAKEKECICIMCRNKRCKKTCNLQNFLERYNLEEQLYLKDTTYMGVGVRGVENIPAGQVIGLYSGVVKPNCDFSSDYSAGLAVSSGVAEERPVHFAQIDAAEEGNWARFINHSCTPNCELTTGYRVGSKRIVAITTTAPIKAHRSLTVDYGNGYFVDETTGLSLMDCKCRTKACRYRVGEIPGVIERTRGSAIAGPVGQLFENQVSSDAETNQVFSDVEADQASSDVEMKLASSDAEKNQNPSDVEMTSDAELKHPEADHDVTEPDEGWVKVVEHWKKFDGVWLCRSRLMTDEDQALKTETESSGG